MVCFTRVGACHAPIRDLLIWFGNRINSDSFGVYVSKLFVICFLQVITIRERDQLIFAYKPCSDTKSRKRKPFSRSQIQISTHSRLLPNPLQYTKGFFYLCNTAQSFLLCTSYRAGIDSDHLVIVY